ncbi:MAG TPA: DUF4907 domain-containing protein [Bacteroidales bacterium]|jgi:hypothetical protein|nr:DUF4907 domain-containing protein [Bacteroidales bacterium]
MKKTKTRIFIASALFLMIVGIAITFIKRGHSYDLQIFRSGNGWGYDILKNDRVYIHQPFIPAIEGETPFSDRESARRTGRLVISKIRKHKIPAVSKEEIDSILTIKNRGF